MRQITVILMLALCAAAAFGQDITNTLGSGGSYYVKDAVNTLLTTKQSTGLTGIGANATNPRAQLEVGGTDGLLVTGTTNVGTVRALGAGSRLHYYPRKGAFRVGYAESSYWDDNGSATPNLALYSIGMGYQPRATGVASTAIGAYNWATADYSLALGSYSHATGSHSIAIGTQAIASGIYDIAIGSGANTNGHDGAMVIGDDTYFQTAYASDDNQLTMRFSGSPALAGGTRSYRLWTWYPDSSYGVYMRNGMSGWFNYCARVYKENFRALEGEEVLTKIRDIPVTEWNYKGTPALKYIGPVAEDFYRAFRLSGDDSTGINSICIDGVNMAGVQALEKRTARMQAENEALRAEVQSLKAQLTALGDLGRQLSELKEIKAELTRRIKDTRDLTDAPVMAQSAGCR